MLRSRNHCCHGNKTRRSAYYWATRYCQQYTNTLRCNNALPLYCSNKCRCQQYKSFESCHGNATVGFLGIFVELQNISYCCQQSKCTWVFTQCPIFYPISKKLNFFEWIFLKVSNSKCHTIRPAAAQFTHAGRQADMTKPKRAWKGYPFRMY